ncbi:dihydroorotase family protein [Persicobacter sp. CCB-QB2]|uniref:dihydroorotase n=1 Tax=Persicobacter sp. CCB-QB2 TaxID=1561025 RepID=UPI0006A96898|nr:dihydroorotase [Persicobacter sp. CCB-QB2]
MSILIQNARIMDAGSSFHGQTANVLVDDQGKIAQISQQSLQADETIDAQGMILTIGWFDLQANYCDPGLEHKEDLYSGRAVAQASGFTEVALVPETEPVIQTKNDIRYIQSGNRTALVQLHALGALTKGLKGEDFTEINDLHEAGAVGFSQGNKPLYNSDILLKSLQYLQKFDGILMNRPEDRWMSMFGLMHEGVESTILGMKGIPSMAEELMVIRDLKLLEYAGGKIHLSNISTKEAVAKIREAKAQGLKVSCDIAAHQLCFTDEDLHTFDTNLKVFPPFRSKEHQEALIAGLKDGTIDAVVSAHQPQDQECKQLEFDLADAGIAGQQTLLHSLLNSGLEMELWLEKLTIAPRELLRMEVPSIAEGVQANLTLFDPENKWTLDASTNQSKSENNPYWGQELTGRVKATFNNGQYHIEY